MTTLAILDVKFQSDATAVSRSAAQANAAIGSVGKTAATASTGVGSLDRKLGSVANRASTVGSTLNRSVTVPVALMGAAAIKASIDFESSFAGVRKTVEASEAEFNALALSIRAMAREIPVGVNELNAIAEAAGALGIAKNDILAFTRVVADMSVTTDLTSDAAATALGKLGNILGLTGDEYSRLASAVVDLGNKGASTESEIVELTLRLAGSAKVAGFAAHEIVGLAAALADAGINAEAGGTAMSRVIQKIGVAVAKGSAELAGFAEVAGSSADEFASKWETAPAQALSSFVAGLAVAVDKGENLDLILEDLGITEARQIDTLKRLANAQNDVASRLGISAEAWQKNAALAEEAEKRYQTMEGQLKTLANQLYDVAIDIGPTLIPVVKDVLEAVRDLAEGFRDLPKPLQGFIIKALVLGAVLGPALKALSGFLTVLRGVAAVMRFLSTVKTATALADTATGLAGVGTQLTGLPAKVSAFDRIFRTSLSQMSGFALGFAGTLGVIGAAVAGWQIGTAIYEGVVKPWQDARAAAEDARLSFEANLAVFDAVGERVPEIATAMHDVTTELQQMKLDGDLSAETLARLASAENVSALRAAAEAGANMAAATRAMAGGMSAAGIEAAVASGILLEHSLAVATVADETGRVVTLMQDAAGNTKAFVEHGGKIKEITIDPTTASVAELAAALGIGADEAGQLIAQLNSIPREITTTYTLKAIIDPVLTGEFAPDAFVVPPSGSEPSGPGILGAVPNNAGGGLVAAHDATWVGEAGREIFIPETDGRIVPNHRITVMDWKKRGRAHAPGFHESRNPDYATAPGITIIQQVRGNVVTERELYDKAHREIIRRSKRDGTSGIRR